jgi:hypothetical protein
MGISKQWGGRRPGSGRTQRNFRLDLETATWLKLLALRLNVKEEQVIATLVRAEWKKIEEVEAAVRAEIDRILKSEQ